MDFFLSFSFLGRIVSELGLVLSVPFVLCCARPEVMATWGMEVTVSVSTVMLCKEPSPALPLAPALADTLDCLVVSGGALVAPAGAERRPALTLPLSLPLSARSMAAAALDARLLDTGASDESSSEDDSEMMLSSSFSSSSSCALGDARGLASWTVSSMDEFPPRAGVRTPPCGGHASSDSDRSGWVSEAETGG